MKPMRRPLKVYLSTVMLAAAVAVLVSLLVMPPTVTAHTAVLSALLVGLASLSYLAPVKLAPKRAVVLTTALETVALLSMVPAAAAVTMALATALGNVYRRRRWFNVGFNAGQVALSLVSAGTIYHLLAPVADTDPVRSTRGLAALLPAGLVLYLISALAVDGAAAIQQRRSPFVGWLSVHGPELVPHGVLVAIGAVTAIAVEHSPWLLLVAAAPVALIRTVMSASLQLDARLVARVEQLADAAESRLPPGQRASRCAAELARRLAVHRGLAAHECQRVSLAARLLQAMALDQALTSAADASVSDVHAISRAERACLQLGLRPVAEIVHFCQESFDGRGQPHGLAGQDIPLSSRIVAVCTAWTTLTTARPHRPALDDAQAMLVLRAGAGTRWDPDLVQRLLDVLRSGEQAVPVPARGAAPAMAAATA